MTNTTQPTTSSSVPPKPTIEQIKTTHERLIALQQALDDALDAFARDHSLLTKMATYWGKKPLWLRVSVGAAIIVPLLLISIMMQLAVLLTISLFVSLIYIAGDLLLTSHDKQASVNTQKFKNIVKNLNTLQTSLIELTNELNEQLKQEIDKITTENTQLTDNVSRLDKERIALSLTIEQLKITEQQLKKLVCELETTAQELKSSMGIQSDLFVKTQTQLELVRKEYEQNQIQLSEQIQKIAALKQEMETDRAKAQNTIQILNKSVGTLTGVLTLSAEQRILFDKKLTEFIENNEQRFENLAKALSQSTTKIADTTERYTDSTNDFRDLLIEQKQLFNRLESIVVQFDEIETSTETTLKESVKAPIRFGLFAEKTPGVHPPQGELTQLPEIPVH